MQDDKDNLINLFSNHAAPKQITHKETEQVAIPAIQLLSPSITTCHIYNAPVTQQITSDSENPCIELQHLKNEISRLESLLKNK